MSRIAPVVAAIFVLQTLHSSGSKAANLQSGEFQGVAQCASETPPYRDLDFLTGVWEFFTLDGVKIADQIYHRRGNGCVILEDWTTLGGETGTGMNFVDPRTGKWRQVWMSPMFHLDYSGGLAPNGNLVLEGYMHSNLGRPDAQIRGVYSRQKDGSVTKEFLMREKDGDEWRRFFIGVAKRPSIPKGE